jgi:hypothetical protein
MNNSWIDFWKFSANFVNSAIREDVFELNEDKELLEYYKENLDIMNKEISKKLTSDTSVYYRNTYLNSFELNNINDIIEIKTYISCFKDSFNYDYGPYEILIKVPENTPYLEYDNVIIFSPSKLRILNIEKDSCILELLKK